MPHTVHYPEQPSQGHVTPPPSRDAPVRFVLCCVAKTDNIRIYLVFHDEFTQRLIEEGKMVSKSKAHCRRMLQALQQTRAGILTSWKTASILCPSISPSHRKPVQLLFIGFHQRKRRNEQ